MCLNDKAFIVQLQSPFFFLSTYLVFLCLSFFALPNISVYERTAVLVHIERNSNYSLFPVIPIATEFCECFVFEVNGNHNNILAWLEKKTKKKTQSADTYNVEQNHISELLLKSTDFR